MESKADGREYARITRRVVVIIKNIRHGRAFTLTEVANELHEKKLPEFFLQRFNRPMSVARTRDYVRYLAELNIIKVVEGNQYSIEFRRRNTDEEWAQTLSDTAREHMARVMNISPVELPDTLERTQQQFFRQNELPTVEKIVTALGIEGLRNQEFFRWSLYMYTDGDACPFDIRHYPTVLQRGR